MINFIKYQALGNDYLVIEPNQLDTNLNSEEICMICDRHYGVGADGILYGPLPSQEADFAVQIFNPDGSEAEKSGNGLRILARHLWDSMRLDRIDNNTSNPFTVHTLGGIVKIQVLEAGQQIRVEMGKAQMNRSIQGLPIPINTKSLDQINIDNEVFHYISLNLGNPHCVIINAPVDPITINKFGPMIENDPRFPNRTNVQFMQVIDHSHIHIGIWERGAGFTLASGSSSCAAAFAAYLLGFCGYNVNVQNPGGMLQVSICEDRNLILTGPVEKVFEGNISLK